MLANQFRDLSKLFSYNHQNYYTMGHFSIQIYPVKSLIAAAILFCSSFAFGQCYDEDRLLAYYPFDGDANDESGGNWPGRLRGAPRFSDGKLGQAIYFDGERDYVTIDTGFQLPNDFTVSAWVNVDTIAEPPLLLAGFQAVFVKASTLLGGPFWCGLRGREVVFLVGNGEGEDEWLVSAPIISEDSTFHIAWVRDQGSAYIYVNCELVASRDNVPEIIQNSDTVSIGGRVAEDGKFRNRFKGWIDDLRVYNGPLSIEEICCLVPTHDVHFVDLRMRVSPNPNPGFFNVKFQEEEGENLRISIFDLSGRKVREQELVKGTALLDFDLSEEAGGIYFLVVQDGSGQVLQRQKIIIARD
ncbi:MAG: T9SS type A sorting domain-containing protein [Lewinellaceae bacterium]|nr:T9SS type A sorting domain-containing protein [Lewinellaceae bacterium]